jgi:polynucleotide 5'-hydroxyl-kinase GRC3/NOL9
MDTTVDKNKTLLVDGPASVTVASGCAEVFGSVVRSPSRIIIREGKRLPFAVEEKATFGISLGESAIVEEEAGNTIPSSWMKSFEELLSFQNKPVTAMVLGTVDSGKTSFSTYLINRLLREKKKIAVLDGDLGQSDVGPPGTVAYTLVTKPVTDLFNLQAKDAFFIGVTSPSAALNKVIDGLSSLKKEILTHDPDFIVINTDGWIEQEDAIYYKIKLVEELNPDIIFCIQQKDELMTVLNALEKYRKTMVESPPAIGQRTRERRKNLRELGYVKYLRNAKVQTFPLGWLKVEDSDIFGLDGGRDSPRRVRKICELLGMKPLHFVELKDKLSVIIGKNRWINAENIKKAEEYVKKKVVITRKGEEQGILTGVHDANRKFKGIGIIQEIDYLRKTLKLSTPVSDEISVVVLGKVKLDRNLREIPAFDKESEDTASLKRLL